MTLFDGITYDPEQDQQRLNTQLERVLDLMKDGTERTLAQISSHVRGSEAGVSARLRDFRKVKIRAKYGAWNVVSRRVEGGLWTYKLERL